MCLSRLTKLSTFARDRGERLVRRAAPQHRILVPNVSCGPGALIVGSILPFAR